MESENMVAAGDFETIIDAGNEQASNECSLDSSAEETTDEISAEHSQQGLQNGTDTPENDGSNDDETEGSLTVEEATLLERVSGFLFVSPRPLSVEKLAELCDTNDNDVRDVLDRIAFELKSSGLGVELVQVGGSFQFRTIARIKKSLQALITPKMKRLSKAAAETLAVIAYKQPVPRAEIEAIRGVDALPTLKTLLDARLIRIVGREDTPGSPALYGTTEFFLERFGLSGLSELPTVREIAQMEEETADSKQLELFAEQDGQDDEMLETDEDNADTEMANTLNEQLEVSESAKGSVSGIEEESASQINVSDSVNGSGFSRAV